MARKISRVKTWKTSTTTIKTEHSHPALSEQGFFAVVLTAVADFFNVKENLRERIPMGELEKEIFELECSHLQPDVRVSGEKLGNVLDDEFYEFGSSGRITFRSDYEEDNSLTPDRMEISEFQMHELGPEAVLTTYRIFNETSGRRTNRSSVWKKRGTEWKLFFHQGTVST